MMLDKKQIQMIFLFKFKMDCKTAETTHINNAFDPETTNKHIVWWWFSKFCKQNKSLEDEEHSGWPLGVDNNQLRKIIKADPLTTIQEIAKELSVNHSMMV